jgi:hypothetical protein
MIDVLGVPVTVWCLFLTVIGIILSMHITRVEGFANSGSGSYMMPLTPVYVQDCMSGTCESIRKNTDRLTYRQRLYVGGKLVSANERYVLYYQPSGILVLNDLSTTTVGSSNILWRSNTLGTSSFSPSFLAHLGNIRAIGTAGDTLPWIATPNPGGPSYSGSSGSSGSSPVYTIPGYESPGMYLQVTDYGDLIVKNSAGSIIWSANASPLPPLAPNTDECVPDVMYPFTETDCYSINQLITSQKTLLNSLTLGISCEAGYYCPGGTSTRETMCPAGTYCPVNSMEPIDCPAGYYSAQGAAQCTACPAGQTSLGGEAVCAPCPAGETYTGGVCMKCQPGTYSSVVGSTSCTPCPAGHACAAAGTVTPQQCAAGTSSPAGAATCTPCPAGKYSLAGSTSCIACPDNTTSVSGAATCTGVEQTISSSGYSLIIPSVVRVGTPITARAVSSNPFYSGGFSTAPVYPLQQATFSINQANTPQEGYQKTVSNSPFSVTFDSSDSKLEAGQPYGRQVIWAYVNNGSTWVTVGWGVVNTLP